MDKMTQAILSEMAILAKMAMWATCFMANNMAMQYVKTKEIIIE